MAPDSSSREAAKISSCAAPAPSRSARTPPVWRPMSCSGPRARGVTSRSQPPHNTRARAPHRRANSLTSTDLPMPASPATTATRPPPRAHSPSRPSRSSSVAERSHSSTPPIVDPADPRSRALPGRPGFGQEAGVTNPAS
ncbi:unnamed protein product [[Actinomadura] parvosata subsp. kistnae]|nr:unnamed protein product [Actinomadura parvosata subsp. kistnae]